MASLKSLAYSTKRKVEARARRQAKLKAGLYDSTGTRPWSQKVSKTRKKQNASDRHRPGTLSEEDKLSIVEEIKGTGGLRPIGFGPAGKYDSGRSAGVPSDPFAGLSNLDALALWKRRRREGVDEPPPG